MDLNINDILIDAHGNEWLITDTFKNHVRLEGLNIANRRDTGLVIPKSIAKKLELKQK